MPNHLVESLKGISGEKIQANLFFIYLFIPSGFFCWRVTGIQPEPLYVNLLEGVEYLTQPNYGEGRGAAEPQGD